MNYNLAQPFYESARGCPGNVAINANGQELLYRDVLQQVMAVSAWLRSNRTTPARVGILASRSADACIAILAAVWVGAAYVPINPAFPENALLGLIQRSGLDALIADKEGSELLTPRLLAACPTMVLARRSNVPGASPDNLTDYADLSPCPAATAPAIVESAAPAYILYTSGTTGEPKGVVVPAGAVAHLLNALDSNYALVPGDRVAETTATTFDLSVYNMFATWRAAASLHIVPAKQMMVPLNFIREHRLTVWFSVPSVAALLARMKLLRPGVFPTLRQTFFAGEPLLATVAAEWRRAAPSSVILNMYGPTETTVICTGDEVHPDTPATRGILPIGRPFVGIKAAIATPELAWVDDGVPGELLLSGPQLALGYLDDPEKTQSKFVDIDGERWYKSGDLATRDSNGVLHFRGRIDNQVKVLGYRVELEDIEFHLRAVTGCHMVAAVAWPLRDGSAAGIVAFLAAYDGQVEAVREALKQRVPSYMVPAEIHSLPRLPMNPNHKIDRNALKALLGSQPRRWLGQTQSAQNPAAAASE